MPRGNPRSAAIPVRVTEAERNQLKLLARTLEMTLSEAARYAIQGITNPNNPEFRRTTRATELAALSEALGELRRIGGLYALQAKGSRQVSEEHQATLDSAIAATEDAMRRILS